MTEIDFYFFLRTGWLLGPFALMEQMATTTAARRAPIIRCVCVPLHHFTFFFYRFISFLPSKVSQSSVNDVLVRRHFSFSHVRSIHALSIYIAAGRGARNTFVIQHLYYVWSLSASFMALASLSLSIGRRQRSNRVQQVQSFVVRGE